MKWTLPEAYNFLIWFFLSICFQGQTMVRKTYFVLVVEGIDTLWLFKLGWAWKGWPLVGDVYCIFVTFPCGILGQVWYLIVLFPDLCRLSHLVSELSRRHSNHKQQRFDFLIECKLNDRTCQFYFSHMDQKVKTYFFLKVVMLHIKLKGMEHRAPCKHIFCPYTHPRPLGWGQRVKALIFSK